jgi:hypothetical protein
VKRSVTFVSFSTRAKHGPGPGYLSFRRQLTTQERWFWTLNGLSRFGKTFSAHQFAGSEWLAKGRQPCRLCRFDALPDQVVNRS